MCIRDRFGSVHSTESSGVPIHNLEEEDCHLLQGDTVNCSDSDTDVNDFIYHERIQPGFLTEAWDLADKDVDKDFLKPNVSCPQCLFFQPQEYLETQKLLFVGC